MEITLEKGIMNILLSTQRYDRGYLIAERNKDCIVVHDIEPADRGKSLIARAELTKTLLRVLHESGGIIPYIHDIDHDTHFGDAANYFLDERKRGMNNFFAYCVVNGKPRFSRVIKTSYGGTREDVPFRLLEEQRTK